MSKETHTRLFSLEDDFMNFKTDDLLYGFLRTLSTAEPLYEKGKPSGKCEEYLTKKEYLKNKKAIAALCGCSTRTIERHLETLFATGLIEEGIKEVNILNKDGTESYYDYACFWFPHDEKGKYKIIEKDMLSYLITTRNPQCIRVYLYLLNKYEWKKSKGQEYVFTLMELQKALGYSENTKGISTMFSNIVDSLAREGIIRYENIYEYVESEGGEIHKVPRKVLKFVANSVKQLRDPVQPL